MQEVLVIAEGALGLAAGWPVYPRPAFPLGITSSFVPSTRLVRAKVTYSSTVYLPPSPAAEAGVIGGDHVLLPYRLHVRVLKVVHEFVGPALDPVDPAREADWRLQLTIATALLRDGDPRLPGVVNLTGVYALAFEHAFVLANVAPSSVMSVPARLQCLLMASPSRT
jgi:hypothetical protein